MATVTFLLGLAGSGKSHKAREMMHVTGARLFEGIAAPERTHLLHEMIEHLRKGGDCAVEEIAFCHPACREQIVGLLKSHIPSVRVEWLCFENDVESANWNVMNRNDEGKEDIRGHLEINLYWRGRYTYPVGATIIPIVRVLAKTP